MLNDIERLLEQYFPEEWQETDVTWFSGKPRFTRDIEAADAALNQPIRNFILRGGKRLRPLLFLTLIEIFGKEPKRYLDFALFVELIHNGTLVVDDVEDNSELRRGLPTLHKSYGLDIAINAGVMMHILPLRILLEERDYITEAQRLKAFTIYAEELNSLHLGQATDIYWHRNSPEDVSVEKYLEMCRLKTGSLMRVSVRLACALTEQDEATENALKVFAESAGIAFQIKDDVLDLTADKSDFGKSFGNDITEGKFSLPVILALQTLAVGEQQRLIEILQMHTHDKALLTEARDLIIKTKAHEQAMEKAQQLFDEAWQKVAKSIPDEKDQQALQELTQSFIKRNH